MAGDTQQNPNHLNGHSHQHRPTITHWSQSVYNEWLHKVKQGGSVALQADFVKCCQGWSAPPGNIFHVRGPNYMETKLKIEAGEWLLEPIGFDWARSDNNTKLCKVMFPGGGSRVREAMEEADRRQMLSEDTPAGALVSRPFVWAFNIQIPSKDHHSLIMYYACDPVKMHLAQTEPDNDNIKDPHVAMIRQFVRGGCGADGDAYRNQRLKLVASVPQGPWIVKRAVGERAGACLIGRAVTCHYFPGADFMEIDVDVSSSMLAHAIVQLAFGSVVSLTVDIAFLIESQAPHELPEKLLGAIRFANLVPGNALVIRSQPLRQIPTPPPTPPASAAGATSQSPSLGRPSSYNRLWRSFSNLIHHQQTTPESAADAGASGTKQ